MTRRVLPLLLAAVLVAALLAGCGGGTQTKSADRVRTVIQEAETMTLEELARKAIEESGGKTLLGVGSPGGQGALDRFADYLRSLDPAYAAELRWETLGDDDTVEALAADAETEESAYSVALLRENSQAERRLIQANRMRLFLPKEWTRANSESLDGRRTYLALRIVNKVFVYDREGDFTPGNCWELVAEGRHGSFVDIDAEASGRNFLCMLTKPEYAAWLREAFEALPAGEQAAFQPVIDSVAADAEDLGLEEDGPYALAWIKLWIGSYRAADSDEAICAALLEGTGQDSFGLTTLDELHARQEWDWNAVRSLAAAATNSAYRGIGGFGYTANLFIPDNAPLPWTACAFLAFVTCTEEGYTAWDSVPEGASANRAVRTAIERKIHPDGSIQIPDRLDRSLDWWLTGGKLVLEDPGYCASVADTVGSWIDVQLKYRPE